DDICAWLPPDKASGRTMIWFRPSRNLMEFIYNMHAMHIAPDFDLTQIKLLAELLRLRHVSMAAQQIGLSQSAASHALAKLRKRLGDPLFTRTTDGFQPT